MMKKNKLFIKLCLVLTIVISLFSCSPTPNGDSLSAIEETATLKVIEPPKAITQWETSLVPTFEKADLVIRGTVTDVGAAQ